MGNSDAWQSSKKFNLTRRNLSASICQSLILLPCQRLPDDPFVKHLHLFTTELEDVSQGSGGGPGKVLLASVRYPEGQSIEWNDS